MAPRPAEAAGDPPSGTRPDAADRDAADTLSDDLEQVLSHSDADDDVRVLVQLDRPADVDVVRAHERHAGDFDVARRYEHLDGYAATMTARQVRGLTRRGDVLAIEPDREVRALLDTAKVELGVEATTAEFGVDGDGDGHPRRYSKNDVVIAVIDTGVDWGHEDLDEGKVLVGKNFLSSLSSGCTAPNPAGHDDHDDGVSKGHGTHVASIAAGSGDAGTGFAGVAPGAAIVSLKALDCKGKGSTSDVVAALDWAIANKATYGIDVLNLSLGSSVLTPTEGTDAVSRAVNRAIASGIVTVVAAGNNGPGTSTITSPGGAKYAVTVGAAADPKDTDGDNLPGFRLSRTSGRGPTADGRVKPDIVAPGIDIRAAEKGTDNGYVEKTGTSMASPFVAGVAALLLDAGEAPPSGTPCDACTHGVEDASMSDPVKDRLMGTATDWGTVGADNDYGAGLVNAYEAVDQVHAFAGVGAPQSPQHHTFTGTLTGGNTAQHTLTVDCPDWPVAVSLHHDATTDFDLSVGRPDGDSLPVLEGTRYEWTADTSPATGVYIIEVSKAPGSGDGSYVVDTSAGEAACGAGVSLRTRRGVVSTYEIGPTSDTYTVVLDSAPAANVTVDVSADSDASVSPGSLTFTTGNWSTPQPITATAVVDGTSENAHTSVITHSVVSGDLSYDGLTIRRVLASVNDDPQPAAPPPPSPTSTPTTTTTTTTTPSTTTTVPKAGAPAPVATVEMVGDGYVLIDDKGGLFSFGNAPFLGSVPGLRGANPGLEVGRIVGAFPTHQGRGYVAYDEDGRVFNFGTARNLGSVYDRWRAGQVGRARIVVAFPTDGGDGYVMVDEDGGVHTFGSARYHGSVPELRQTNPIGPARVITGFAVDGGRGYVLIDDVGGLFAFGSAPFHGSVPALRNAGVPIGPARIVGGFSVPNGYVMIDDVGGLFAFGSARYFGSVPGLRDAGVPIGPAVVVGGFSVDDGKGYVMIDDAGGLFAFGSARFFGSVPGLRASGVPVGPAKVIGGFAV